MKQENLFGEPGLYQIRVKGHLEGLMAGWFKDFEITLETNGESRLTGNVSDQADLHKVLKKIRDFGLPLLAVERISMQKRSP